MCINFRNSEQILCLLYYAVFAKMSLKFLNVLPISFTCLPAYAEQVKETGECEYDYEGFDYAAYEAGKITKPPCTKNKYDVLRKHAWTFSWAKEKKDIDQKKLDVSVCL